MNIIKAATLLRTPTTRKQNLHERELDSGSEPEATPVSKRRRTYKAKNPPKISNQKAKNVAQPRWAGKLRLLFEMPIDILFEVIMPKRKIGTRI
jgi:hypothetical protein